MTNKKKCITDALEILHHRYIKGDKKRLESIKREKKKLDIAEQIYNLRIEVGLTQREFAGRIGTTRLVICSLEAADYELVREI